MTCAITEERKEAEVGLLMGDCLCVSSAVQRKGKAERAGRDGDVMQCYKRSKCFVYVKHTACLLGRNISRLPH